MKTFLFAVLAIAAVTALPYGNDPDYAMVPDGEGNFKLVNIHEDPEPESFFDAPTDTVFLLFTRSNPLVGHSLEIGNLESLTSSRFNPAHPTRFIIHGWQSNAYSPTNVLIRAEYFSVSDFNVIVVDWSAGAETINYIAARNRVGDVGAVTSQVIQMISRQFPQAHPRDMVVIGHSLGAHVAGFAGKNQIGDNRLGAIVALDAALPLFSIEQPAQRVNINDALLVESIHTNGGLLGFDVPLGHSNFYPNGGTNQPGCGIDVAGSCAHSRAVEYFAESISSTRGFWGRECASHAAAVAENCTPVGVDRKMGGEPIDTLARGIYWLSTNRASPFATGIL